MNHSLIKRIPAILLSALLCTVVCLTAVGVIATPAFANEYDKEILVNMDFSGKNLTDSSFNKANLRGSNFSHTNLQGVSLFGAYLDGANFEGADMRNATLDTAR